MSGRFVRASKYRHVFGQSSRREQCYDNLRISKNAWDTNLVKANAKYLSVNWESGGGGAFAVIPLEERGKLPEQIPLFRGHTAVVLDTDWNPFDDSIIASASDDGKVFVWQVPENFALRTDAEEPEDVKPVGKLSGHSRKVGHVLFNPAAENVLASASGDYTVKIWDLEDGKAKLTLKGSDIFTSLSWSADGSTLVTTSRDKKLRFWDVRQERPAHEVAGHGGAKNSRSVWMGDHDRVVTVGFSKMSERQLALWDVRNPSEPIDGFMPLDSGSGVSMPFWDEGSQILYIAGKGDGNIRYYEYQNDKFEYLSEYRSSNAQRGIAFIPKRGVNTHDNEITRAFKTVDDAYIEPISFVVPRRAETFQEDIYPPTVGTEPAMSSPEWFGGKSGLPPKFSMEDIYENRAPQMMAAEATQRPTATTSAPASQPAPKSEPKVAEAPVSAAAPPAARETTSVNDNKQSMAAMANKFADKDGEESDGNESPFEEIQKPVERPSVARQEPKVTPAAAQDFSKTTTAARQEQKVMNSPATNNTSAAATEAANAAYSLHAGEGPSATSAPSASELREKESAQSPPSSSSSTTASAAGGLRDVLHEIRGMLQAQGKQIEQLTSEVAQLKAKMG